MTDEQAERDPEQVARAVDALLDQHRSRCAWFLRSDYYPATLQERLRILSYVERYGDVHAFQEAGRLKKWLPRNSSETSAR